MECKKGPQWNAYTCRRYFTGMDDSHGRWSFVAQMGCLSSKPEESRPAVDFKADGPHLPQAGKQEVVVEEVAVPGTAEPATVGPSPSPTTRRPHDAPANHHDLAGAAVSHGRPPSLLGPIHGSGALLGTSPRSPSPLSASSIHVDAAVLRGGGGMNPPSPSGQHHQHHLLHGRSTSGLLVTSEMPGSLSRQTSR